MLTFHCQPARESRLSKLPFKIVLVDYRQIGTHEHIRHPEAVNKLTQSILDNGYQGPPLAVFQAGSDDWFNQAHPGEALDTGYGQLGIADGHHRLQALTALGDQRRLNSQWIPVQLIPARHPGLVHTATMRDGEKPLPVTDVEACFADPEAIIPPTVTTHFQICLSDGRWVRLAQGQPDLIISHNDLVRPID